MVLLPRYLQYYGPLRLPLHAPPFHGFTAYRTRCSRATSWVGFPVVSLPGCGYPLGAVSPVPTLTVSPFHVPYAAGFVGAAFQALHPVRGLHPSRQARLPVALLAEGAVDAADFTSCCGLVSCTFLKKARPRASTPKSPQTLAGCYKGGLVPPLAGLPPASQRELSGRTANLAPGFNLGNARRSRRPFYEWRGLRRWAVHEPTIHHVNEQTPFHRCRIDRGLTHL